MQTKSMLASQAHELHEALVRPSPVCATDTRSEGDGIKVMSTPRSMSGKVPENPGPGFGWARVHSRRLLGRPPGYSNAQS
jgi:hypothetical protein